MSIILKVRVLPRASRSEIVGDRDGTWKIRLTSPPVDGAANIELIKLLSTVLEVAKSSIEIVRGETSREKSVCVQGVSETAAAALLKANSRP